MLYRLDHDMGEFYLIECSSNCEGIQSTLSE